MLTNFIKQKKNLKIKIIFFFPKEIKKYIEEIKDFSKDFSTVLKAVLKLPQEA